MIRGSESEKLVTLEFLGTLDGFEAFVTISWKPPTKLCMCAQPLCKARFLP